MAKKVTSWVAHLYALAQKPSRMIVGLMSGTSVDGLDIALCYVENSGVDTQLRVIHSKTVAYDEYWVSKIKNIFAKKLIDTQELCLLNAEIGTLHGSWVKEALDEWGIAPQEVDLVASHGQTLFHAPQHFHKQAGRPHSTLQIGDGDHVAAACGIITLCDFRQRHIAWGGEGAPLVLYADKLLFSSDTTSRLLINLGGIANFTWLPKTKNSPPLASDAGPANTLLDAYCQHYVHQPCDTNGERALLGKVDKVLLSNLMSDAFFSQSIPKTTGPEYFNLSFFERAKKQSIKQSNTLLSHEDCLATLAAFTAECLVSAIKQVAPLDAIDEIICSGGGVHNTAIMQALRRCFAPVPVNYSGDLGVSPNDKEAALFAVLANECIAGTPDISMGKVCFPS